MVALIDASTDERASKRPRLSNAEDQNGHSDLSSVVSNKIYSTLGVFPPNGLEDLDEDAM